MAGGRRDHGGAARSGLPAKDGRGEEGREARGLGRGARGERGAKADRAPGRVWYRSRARAAIGMVAGAQREILRSWIGAGCCPLMRAGQEGMSRSPPARHTGPALISSRLGSSQSPSVIQSVLNDAEYTVSTVWKTTQSPLLPCTQSDAITRPEWTGMPKLSSLN